MKALTYDEILNEAIRRVRLMVLETKGAVMAKSKSKPGREKKKPPKKKDKAKGGKWGAYK